MSGTLQASVVKDSASATNNLALDASGNVTVGNNLTVTGTSTLTGAVSQTGSSTAASFIPTGSTVPANGMYLSAANTVNIATNSTNQLQISSSGIVTGTAGNLMLVQGTSQASTSGTSIDFTNIPSWAKRIVVNFVGVSTTGTSNIIVQLGVSGTPETSNYLGATALPGVTTVNWSSGMLVTAQLAAADLWYGQAVICLTTGNTWTGTVNMAKSNAANTGQGAGSKALAGTLNMVRITTAAGTDTFDAGTINIQYE